jgi:hypothetical protein
MNVRFNHTQWNHGLENAGRLRPLPGLGIGIKKTDRGSTVYVLDGATEWEHPWKVTPRWRDGAWAFHVAPGFVNGEPPVVPGVENEEGEDATILEAEWIKVNDFVILGNDAENSVPDFFKDLGAKNSFLPPGFDPTKGVNASQLEDLARPAKSLAKFDVFISKARAQLVSEPQVVDATGVTGQIFQAAIRYDLNALNRLGATPRLLHAAKMPVVSALKNAVLRILGLEPDVPEDRLLIATVYLLAPDEDGDKPDEDWRPFVEQKVFWNLTHAPKIEVPRVTPDPIRFNSGLAAGVGDAIINQNLAILNQVAATVSAFADEASRVEESSNVGGRYWTA